MSTTNAEATASSTSVKRLPPNHRRRRVPLELRKRAVKACNSCNVRRVRCSGDQPCLRCASSSRTCEYPLEVDKIKVEKETYEELQKRCEILQQCLADAVPAERNREALLSKWTRASAAPSTSLTLPQSRSEEEEEQQTGDGRILQDPEGYTRYLGESSGAAFMDRLREFVITVIPLLSHTEGMSSADMEAMFMSLLNRVGRYHTHDSRVLDLPPFADQYLLPDLQDICKMLSVFQFYAGEGAGASSSGGIYYWGDLWDLEEQARHILAVVRPPDGIILLSRDETILLCKLNAIMALACQYNPSLDLINWHTHPGDIYFARAKKLLEHPMEDASLAHMPIFCLMGYYLLGLYRRDAAYMYFGLATRISIIHGLHRGWMISNQSKIGEQSKRDFWNTFILDRWLSTLMGRPVMIPDEAVTLEFPIDIVGVGLPSATGLCAHVKLSMIMCDIVNTIYGVAGPGAGNSHIISRVDAMLDKLSAWHDDLPQSLKLLGRGEVPDRATFTLHMIHNQCIILSTRPLLFQAVKQAVAIKYISLGQRRQCSPSFKHIKICADAARRIIFLIQQLLSNNQAAFRASLEYHFPFTASIVLELARLLPAVTLPDDIDKIKFLVEYLGQAGDSGNESALDCRNMVNEFGAIVSRLLIDDQIRKIQTSSTTLSPSSDSPPQGAIGGSQMSLFRHDMLLSGAQLMLSDGTPLDVGLLGEGQVAAYEELFSWFSP